MRLNTLLPAGLNSVTRPSLPHDISQSPPASLRALPQHNAADRPSRVVLLDQGGAAGPLVDPVANRAGRAAAGGLEPVVVDRHCAVPESARVVLSADRVGAERVAQDGRLPGRAVPPSFQTTCPSVPLTL